MIKKKLKKGKNINKTIKERFLKDFRVKIICFLLALFSFIFIGIIQRDDQSFVCNLEVEGIEDGLVISNSIPTNIKITVYDRKVVLSKISNEDFNVKLVVDAKEPGNYNYRVSWSVPKNIQSLFSTIELEPNNVNVCLEKLVEKSVPTNLNYYNLESNYSIKDMSISPQYVRIVGPESYTKNINYIDTEKISLRGEFDNFKRDVPLIIPPNTHNLKIIGKDSATVSFSIVSDRVSRSFECHKILFKNLDSDLAATFKNPPIYVTLTGNKQILYEISSLDINISVDCSSIKSIGEYKMSMEISVLNNAEVVSINPIFATILITYKNSKELKSDSEDLE